MKNNRLRAAWNLHQQQSALRQTYGINDPNTGIVERKNIFKNSLRIILKALGQGIRFAASAAIAALALIGLAALVYPDTRTLLMDKIVESMAQLNIFLGG